MDFTSQIQEWHKKGYEVFFCGDINEDLHKPSCWFNRIFCETDCANLNQVLYGFKDPPATYAQSQNCLDVAGGSLGMMTALISSCFLPHYQPVLLKGDHQTHGYNFDSRILFGMITQDLSQFIL